MNGDKLTITVCRCYGHSSIASERPDLVLEFSPNTAYPSAFRILPFALGLDGIEGVSSGASLINRNQCEAMTNAIDRINTATPVKNVHFGTKNSVHATIKNMQKMNATHRDI